MVATTDITEFSKDEDMSLTLFPKDRPIPPATAGLALSSASTAVITIEISDKQTGVVLLTFKTTDVSPAIVLADEPTAEFAVELDRTALTDLNAGTEYEWNVYSESVAGYKIHQVTGAFKLAA